MTELTLEYIKYNKHNIKTLTTDNGDIWYRGIDIATVLGYKRQRDAIRQHVNEKNRINFEELCNIYLDTEIKMHKHTIFLDKIGVENLILRSRMPHSIKIAKALNINILQKVTLKETDIVADLNTFCESSGITHIHHHNVKVKDKIYQIDYYLPDYKIAIEIDEFGHKDRDPEYEKKREKSLIKKLGCTFIRCNPDSKKFKMLDFVGKINKEIIESITSEK